MKSVIQSYTPQECERIAQGWQTIKCCKIRPKLETPFKVYIYCCKAKSQWRYSDYEGAYENSNGEIVYAQQHIIGEFICDKVDCYPYGDMSFPTPAYDGDPTVCECGNGYYITCGELEKTCLEYKDLENYGNSKTLYGWHISDLKIYDNPKELSEFHTICNKYESDSCEDCPYLVVERFSYPCDDCVDTWCSVDNIKPITRPPQSWCYVESLGE